MILVILLRMTMDEVTSPELKNSSELLYGSGGDSTNVGPPAILPAPRGPSASRWPRTPPPKIDCTLRRSRYAQDDSHRCTRRHRLTARRAGSSAGKRQRSDAQGGGRNQRGGLDGSTRSAGRTSRDEAR